MKKIAVFMGQLFAEYQFEVTKALREEAEKRSYQLDVFLNFGIYGSNFLYADGEKSIKYIPCLDGYDGIITAPDTYELPGFAEELSKFIRENCDKPVVALRQRDRHSYNVMIDDYFSMSQMVEHFVVDHGFRKIAFMTGKLNMEDAQKRLSAYKDVMAKHNLTIDEHDIYEGDYWRERGPEAVQWFLNQKERPQAIVCSNDYMAISVCDELVSRGIRVPEDISVSGFDDVEESRFYLPPITSMSMSTEGIGRMAIEMLTDIWEGKEIENTRLLPVHMRKRASCGCCSGLDQGSVQGLLAQKVGLEKILSGLSYMNVSFDSADSVESLLATANYYMRVLPFKKIYICMCDEEERANRGTDIKNPYTEKMVLRAMLGGPDVEMYEETFNRRELIPSKYIKDEETLFVVSLHDKIDYYGYLAMVMDDNKENINHVFQMWLLSLADALGELKMYNDSKEVADMRKKIETDMLTGIGNRRMLDRVIRTRHEKMMATKGDPFTILSVDMDDLKGINDTYGHQAGDEALCRIASVLQQECGEQGCAMRTGGDEFQVCLDTFKTEEIIDYVNRVRAALDAINASGQQKYQLSASIGYAVCRFGVPIIENMKLADDKMYFEKREKKKRRELEKAAAAAKK